MSTRTLKRGARNLTLPPETRPAKPGHPIVTRSPPGRFPDRKAFEDAIYG